MARKRPAIGREPAEIKIPPARIARTHFFSLPDAAIWASIFCAILLAYWPALRGGLVWDDASHITNPALQSLHGLWRIWFDLGATQQYYPLLHSAFWMEHRVWGDAVLGYHLTNLILHAVAACLVVRIVQRLSLPGAWLAGLIFALHPVCVEAVAWISEQKSTLSGVFYLGAAMVYLRFDQSRRRRDYLCALGLFVLALLSKTVTATLPIPAGATALRLVLLTTVNLAGWDPKLTLVALSKSEPVIDTSVPPVVGPCAGRIDDTAGPDGDALPHPARIEAPIATATR